MNQILKRIGAFLMLAGVVGLVVTIAGMTAAFSAADAQVASPAEFAGGISSALTASAIGGPFFLVGLVLFGVGWFRGWRADRMCQSSLSGE